MSLSRLILRHMTAIVFTVAVGLSLACLGLLYYVDAKFWPLLVVSISLNAWAIYQSDRAGFVKAKEHRRHGEPPRHLSGMQVITLYFLILAEAAIAIVLPFGQLQ